MRQLPAFELERFLRAAEKTARFRIGGSGIARGVLPAMPDGAWETHPDEAARTLREAVAREWSVEPERVLPTVGASEADFLCYLAYAGLGAHVVVETPAYHALAAPPVALGCRATLVERRVEEGYRLDVGRVVDALTPETKLVALARPHNPTGDTVEAKALVEIADAAARVGARVLVDEVFADATSLGDRSAASEHANVVAVSSVTKCLGFSGLRAGWLIAPRDDIETLDRAKALVSVLLPGVNMLLAARVLDERRRLVQRTRLLRAKNAVAVHKALGGAPPLHGTTLVLRAPHDDVAFARGLLAEVGVVVAPGSFIEAPGRVRVGLLGDEAELREGLARLVPRLR